MSEQELLPAGSGLMARPVDIIPAIIKDHAPGFVRDAKSLSVVTAEDFKRGADLLNTLTKLWGNLNTRRLEAARRYEEAKEKDINAPCAPYLKDLKEAREVVERQLSEFKRKEEEARRKAIEEAETLRLKAEALKKEATAREEAAAQAVEKAKTDRGFAKAAEAFDDGLAARSLSVETKTQAETISIPEEVKARGIKGKEVVEFLEITDLAVLPLTYHEANEVKIKKHILDGTLGPNTPGIRFKVGTKFSGTGR